MGNTHPGLFRKNLRIKSENIHWLNKENIILKNEKKDFLVRIRHRQKLQKATLYIKSNFLYILFREKQRGIAKGQFAAWYKKTELIGHELGMDWAWMVVCGLGRGLGHGWFAGWVVAPQEQTP